MKAWRDRDTYPHVPLESFEACIFFGTPFEGLKGGDEILAYVKERPEQFGPEILPHLLEFMEPESKLLQQLRRDFFQAQKASQADVFSVYETQRAQSDDPRRPKPASISSFIVLSSPILIVPSLKYLRNQLFSSHTNGAASLERMPTWCASKVQRNTIIAMS